MEVTRDIMVNFRCGYLFRPITPDLGINDVPFTSSAAESRLKGYLKEMNADNGETPHDFRSGCVGGCGWGGGAGYPREIDSASFPLGRDFDS